MPTWSRVRRDGEEGMWTQAEAALRGTQCRGESVYVLMGSLYRKEDWLRQG